jgi:hypothetical protein
VEVRILNGLGGAASCVELGCTGTRASFGGSPPVTKAYYNGGINKGQGKVEEKEIAERRVSVK